MAKESKTGAEMPVEEMQAQMLALLEEAKKSVENAKAEAAKIVEDAKKTAEELLKNPGVEEAANAAKKSEEAKAHEAWLNELVEVKLFKDNGKYKDDVFVAVNGENCVIKRGERVKIKRKFALVLENSDRQDYETSKLIEQKSAEFADETAKRNL